MIEADC